MRGNRIKRKRSIHLNINSPDCSNPIQSNPMAALPFSDRLLFSPPKTLSLFPSQNTSLHHFSLSRSSPQSRYTYCPCSAGTLDPDPASEEPDLSSTSITTSFGGGKDRNRRRAVRIAWEKLVRWSRSWRSRNKSDVLQKTRKVGYYLLIP